jgi:hypothetical protein
VTRRRRMAYLCLTVPHNDLPDVEAAFDRHERDVEIVKLSEADRADWSSIDLLSLRMMRYFHLEQDLAPRVDALCAGEGERSRWPSGGQPARTRGQGA